MNMKVTVVIPVYNTKRYLEECVASVIGQTYKEIEILLVDDGSTDGSSALCDELAERDERIRVLHKENGGAATARNLGIDEASGEYVMFLDSDDWLDLDTVEMLIQHADQNHTDVIKFNFVREYGDRQLLKTNTFLQEKLYVKEECRTVCRQILGLVESEMAHPENLNFLASCGFNMYRKELLLRSKARFIPIQEIGTFVDGLFNFEVFMHVERFEFIDRPFYHYRKTNETAATMRYRRNYLNRQLVLFDKLKAEINRQNDVAFFEEAYSHRIVFSTMEIAINALLNSASFFEKYKEIKTMVKHERFKEAYRSFDLTYLGLKWKVYYFFAKHAMVFPLYVMTFIALKLKNKGVL